MKASRQMVSEGRNQGVDIKRSDKGEREEKKADKGDGKKKVR